MLGAFWGGLGTYIGVADLTPSTKAIIARLDIGLGVVAVIAIIAYFIFDHMRERERDERDRERDATQKKILNLLSAPDTAQRLTTDSLEAKVVKTPTEPAKSLRQAGFQLAKEIRDFLTSIPDGLSVEEEHNRVFAYFLKTFWPRLRDIKERFEVMLPKWSVVSSVEWLPTSKERVQKIADNLEQEALRVDKDVLS